MARPKKIDEFEEDIETTEDDYKIDKVEKKYLLITKYDKTIGENLPKNYIRLRNFIAKYRNSNIKKLETPYPIDYPAWIPACTRIIYEVTGIDEDEFVKDVLTIRGWEGYEDTKLADKSPYILMNMIVRWVQQNKNKIQNADQFLAIMYHYIGYGFYWGAFVKFFKRYKPNEQVMKYTIDNMSLKSRLRALGSVDKWLAESVENTYQTYQERLKRGSDFELHYIQEKIRSKLNSAMKTIFRAQQENEKNKNRIFVSQSTLEGEEGSYIVDNTYGMAKAMEIARHQTTKFFAEPINEELIKSVVVTGGLTAKDLRGTIMMIANDRSNIDEVTKFFQSIFTIFLNDSNYDERQIHSIKFYTEMDRLYKPGNTVDPNKIYVREFLDKWLEKGSKTFRTTNRTATILTFRKTLYMYFILKVMKDK